MFKNLIQVYGCDEQFCSAIIRVKTGSMAYGTNLTLEEETLRKRGWVVFGLKHYCRKHGGDCEKKRTLFR
jgi:hypothetical protein